MIENKFDSKFHKFYVGGGEGVIEDKPFVEIPRQEVRPQTLADVLAEYRAYVKDSKAELPAAIMDELRLQGKI